MTTKATAQMGGLMFEEWCKELAAVVGPSLFVLDGEFRLRMSMDLEAFYKRIYESKEQPGEQRWIPVSERLPEGKRGVPYMTFMTDPVLVLHSDRPDYPITAHAALGDSLDARGVCIPTNGASKYKEIAWYSIGRDLCNPFDMASGPKGAFKDSAGYQRFLPCYFGLGITHWMPLPPPPERP